MRLRNKYRAQKTVVDGITFDSKLESSLYLELLARVRTGEFTCIARQVKFPLWGMNASLICEHIVDFLCYLPDRSREAHEAKGISTRDWVIKRKLFEDNYPHIKYIVHKQRSWQKRRRRVA